MGMSTPINDLLVISVYVSTSMRLQSLMQVHATKTMNVKVSMLNNASTLYLQNFMANHILRRVHHRGEGPTTRSPRTRPPPPPRRWTAPPPPSCCRTARSGSGGRRRRCSTALWPWKCRWPPCGRPHRRRGRPPRSSRRRLYRWVLKESIDMPSSVFSRPSSKIVIHS